MAPVDMLRGLSTRARNTLSLLRRHKWKTLIGVLVALPVAAIAMFALSPTQPEYVTALAERGDMVQTVEAVGTVISDRDLQLQFPSSGIVAQVYVKEGDVVRPGQRLAALRAGNLAADISSAAARLQSAEADLRAKQQGARPEDIAITEAEVASKRSSLEAARTTLTTAEDSLKQSQQKLVALKEEAVTSLIGTVSNVGSTVSKELTTASNAMSEVRSVFSKNDVVDAIIKHNSTEHDQINRELQSVEAEIREMYSTVAPADFQQALLLLEKARTAATRASLVIDQAFSLISRLPTTSYFDETARDTYKSSLSAARNSAQTALSNLDSATKSLRDASANFSTRIVSEEAAVASAKGTMDRALSDIATYEASLRISEAQLQLKKAPTRETDLAVATAAVRQYRAALQRAQADYGNTVLTSPIGGKITKVDVKPGEITPVGAAMTLLGDSPYRIEMYVSEIDVPKVQLTQSGSIELDAFRGTNFKLNVTEVDSASTDRDGVSKYRVRLDFIYPHSELKIGMTGDARIVTGTKNDVVMVPVRAVLQDEAGESYVRIMEEGEAVDRPVVAGLEGEGGTIEVDGVEEGETVIVLEKK